MATQASLLGFSSYTVDAITWTPIYCRYAYRKDSVATMENAGAVTVNLRTVSTDSTTEYALLSGASVPMATDGPRATGFSQAGLGNVQVPICWAKAASSTSTLVVIER